mgnify:CR=1 FL=1
MLLIFVEPAHQMVSRVGEETVEKAKFNIDGDETLASPNLESIKPLLDYHGVGVLFTVGT